MAGDRGIQAHLGLIEAEAVLAELESFFYRGNLSPAARASRVMVTGCTTSTQQPHDAPPQAKPQMDAAILGGQALAVRALAWQGRCRY